MARLPVKDSPCSPLFFHGRFRRLAAFTLIELLAVVSIGLILLILAIPAAQRFMRMGYQAKAVSNERQIYLGLVNFHSDHGRLPQITETGQISGSGEPFWNQQILAYMGYDWKKYDALSSMPEVFYDPGQRRNKLRGDFGVVYNATHGPIKSTDPSLSLNALVKPSRTPLVVTAQQFQNGKPIGSWYANNSASPQGEGQNPEISDCHRGGTIVTFADGHTAWMKRDQFFREYMPFRNSLP